MSSASLTECLSNADGSTALMAARECINNSVSAAEIERKCLKLLAGSHQSLKEAWKQDPVIQKLVDQKRCLERLPVILKQ